MSYGERIDYEPNASSMLSATSYRGQHALSILGAAPRKNVDDLFFSQNASNPGYGEDDRASYLRDFELRVEQRRWDRLRDRDRERDRDKERDKELERLRERELDREKECEKERMERREKERDRDRKRALEFKLERTPVRSSKDPSTSKDPRGRGNLHNGTPHIGDDFSISASDSGSE
ncbi:hypothetical protein TSUD_220780 [Trifolium subterraneum]|uniref:Uncharacterized protein n=1 Tax=Trifolium subterraneum TaxID=3900 RepID=A0A2Z6NM66_TRISU|nr:hypothetical protein TSUD_220780 [Trifolium subterraneum]